MKTIDISSTGIQKKMSAKNIILLALLEAETSQTAIARRLGRSVQAVNHVILGRWRSAYIEAELARIVGIPADKLFSPPKFRKPSKQVAA